MWLKVTLAFLLCIINQTRSSPVIQTCGISQQKNPVKCLGFQAPEKPMAEPDVFYDALTCVPPMIVETCRCPEVVIKDSAKNAIFQKIIDALKGLPADIYNITKYVIISQLVQAGIASLKAHAGF